MYKIKKVAVLGSGVMGSGIACHLANAGFEVLLLDIVPFDLTDEQRKDPKLRNHLVNESLKKAIKSKPAPLFDKSLADRITTGNFDDNMKDIKDCQWIIEVVVERLDIKKQVFERVEQYRKPGTLVSSNTSGIPIHLMLDGRSDDFRAHFLGTHFFNPPRYLRLLEIIPTPETKKDVVDFFMQFGDEYLGKQTVLCKDTPAFIANRVGVYAMATIYQLTPELGLPISAVDALTGPAIGRPKTGTFRLGDLVGHDTAVHVMNGIRENCPDDEQAASFQVPDYLKFLLDNKFLGNKTGKGFYEKTDQRDEKGRRIILELDLKTLEYKPTQKPSLASLAAAKQIDDPEQRIRYFFFKADDAGGELVRRHLAGLFAYVSHRIPEISDTLYPIDDALKAGFGWDFGPFEYWDIVGVKAGIEAAEKYGHPVAQWVRDMVAAGHESFYTVVDKQPAYYDLSAKSYKPVPGREDFVILKYYEDKVVYENPELRAYDLGDGVLCCEFRSKMNAIGEGILRGLNEVLDLAQRDGWKGIVIGNNAKNFTVGANLMLVAGLAYEQEFDELNMAVNLFQQTSMRLRYSPVPVVIATQGYVFGGGCELSMHADAVVAGAESYIGLVEVGVGLIPGGGGTKEFALRAAREFDPGGVQIPSLIERFKVIAMGTVSTSAVEAFTHGYLDRAKDQVVINTPKAIARAKQKVLELARHYVAPVPEPVFVLGRRGLGALYMAVNEMKLGRFISDHDALIARKIAYVMCGGDLTGPQKVSQQYLLDLEREAFLSLLGEQKTLERIQHMLTKGKPLRN